MFFSLRGMEVDDLCAGQGQQLLEELVQRRNWPDRLVIALEQSFFQGVDRASCAAEAEVSAPRRAMTSGASFDAGLVVQRGTGRTTRYVASENLRGDLRVNGWELPGPRGWLWSRKRSEPCRQQSPRRTGG
jgi:hypothetical protein